MISKTTLLAILILPVFSVFGQAGTLDPTYADNAEIKLLNFLPADEELLTHSITDSQDRTWIAGETFQNGDWRMILTRLDADGNYDTNFGGTGHAVLNLGGNNVEEVQGLALQGNDLVVAGKIVENGTSNPYLMRYTEEGFLDTDFGDNGIHVSSLEMSVTDMTTDSNQNIYITGVGSDDNIVVVKYLPNGEPDDSFGFFGFNQFDFPSTDQSVAIDLDEEGNVYVMGYGTLNGTMRGHISCLTATGALNTEFTGNSRKSITWPNDKQFYVSDGLFDASTSSFFLVGRAYDSEDNNLNTAAVKIGLNSEQDMSFSEDGWFENDLGIGGDDFANYILKGPGGFYIAANVQEIPEGINSTVIHIDEAGQRVQSFGNSGVATININELGADQALSLTTQSDGKIILTGVAASQESGIYGYAARILTSNPLSTDSREVLHQAAVYPNPAVNFIRVSVDGFNGENPLYRIMDLNGRIVLEGRLNHADQSIDVSALTSGAYILQLDNCKPTTWLKAK